MSIKLQIRNRIYDNTEITQNALLIKELLCKDFKRLEKLLKLDHPEVDASFDYKTIDEFTKSIVITVSDKLDIVSNYLANNYYTFIKVGGVSDPLIRVNALSRLLTPGKIVTYKGQLTIFDNFGKKYRGYLDESPGRPGLHHDFSRAECRTLGGAKMQITTQDISPDENTELFAELDKLNADWKCEGIEERSYIGSLPPTKFFEGDVVTITDPEFDGERNQCLVFRIDWDSDPVKYRVKLQGSGDIRVFDASQFSLSANGVTRLYYSGKPPLQWKDLRAEAEYYLLLGLFVYEYNSATDSYHWTMEQAKQAVKQGDGHGVLQWNGVTFLIRYIFDENVPFDPNELSEAFLFADLVLTF